jgi:Flp pilus assembly protein TadG
MKKYLKNECGQAMVLVALSLVAILGFGAFTVDIGRGAMQQSELQNIADASALAGAQDLPSASLSTNAAISYAGTNGLLATQNGITKDGDKIVVTTPYAGDATKIEVVVTRKIDYTIAQVIGFKEKNASARAVATKSRSGLGPVFDYAIFSGNKVPDTNSFSVTLSNKLVVSGLTNVVNGNIHCNYNVDTNTATILGVAEAVGTVTGNNITTKSPGSSYVAIPDFSSVLPTIKAAAIAANQYYSGNFSSANASSLNVTKPVYVEGNATLTGISFSGEGSIYAGGKITITGSATTYASNSSICIYSGYKSDYKADAAIDFAGSAHDFNGMLYAPNGSILVTGSNYAFNGSVVGRVVDISGSNKTFRASDVSDSFPFAGDISISLME